MTFAFPLFFLLAAGWLPGPGCSGEEAPLEREAWLMGTRLRVSVASMPPSSGAPPGLEGAMAVSEGIVREVERLERLMSTWDPRSEMSRLNGTTPGIPVPVTSELAGILQETLAWVEPTEGAFDPAVGALVDVWGLRGRGKIPSPSALSAARAASGKDLFRLQFPTHAMDGGPGDASPSLIRRSGAAWIDTGAFGKGLALREAARTTGAYRGRIMMDLGGQVWASAPDSCPWEISIAHPLHRRKPVFSLLLAGHSAATSGFSERWIQGEGQRLGHILDPRTGKPAPAWGSVTVVSPDPLTADIVSTALYVMGPDQGMGWSERHPHLGILFLEPCGGEVRATWNASMAKHLSQPPPHGLPQPGPPGVTDLPAPGTWFAAVIPGNGATHSSEGTTPTGSCAEQRLQGSELQ